MQQPTLTVIKNFKSTPIDQDGNVEMTDDQMFSPKKQTEDKVQQFRLKTKIIEDIAREGLDNWEQRMLELLKIDTQSIKLTC